MPQRGRRDRVLSPNATALTAGEMPSALRAEWKSGRASVSSDRTVVMVSGWVLGIFRVRNAAHAESDIRTGDGGALEKTPFGNVVPRKHDHAEGSCFGQRPFPAPGR